MSKEYHLHIFIYSDTFFTIIIRKKKKKINVYLYFLKYFESNNFGLVYVLKENQLFIINIFFKFTLSHIFTIFRFCFLFERKIIA